MFDETTYDAMSHLILTTKLHMPPVPHTLVERSHLLKRLEAGLTRSLTLMCAPAGSGKSTLLSQWLRSQNLEKSSTWLSLDDGDNDLDRFVAYLVAGISRVNENIGRVTEALLEAPQSDSYEALLTPLLNDISAVSEPLILILDDYHLIHNLVIHDAVSFLLSYKPQHFHIVIASRHDPPFPLGQLRVRGQLNEIRANDLGFSKDETADFFQSVVGTELDTQEIEVLDQRTEGWVAGLQLAGLALQGRDSPSDFIADFAGDHTYIVDYLGAEVFKRQSEEICDFLLKTAILSNLSSSLCNAVAQIDNAQDILQQLRWANLFLIPLDDKREWYRYHHLFGDLLLHYLQKTYPEQISDLHQRASQWYEANNLIDEAIYHSATGKDFERAADLIEEYGLAFISQLRHTIINSWIDKLPQSVIRQRALLCVYQAWVSTVTIQPASEVDQYIQEAESALVIMTDAEKINLVKGHIAIIKSYNSRRQSKLEQGLQHLEDADRWLPQDNVIMQCVLRLNWGLLHWLTGDFAKSIQAFQATLAFPYHADTRHMIIASAGNMAELYIHSGQLHLAFKSCENTIKLEIDKKQRVLTPLLSTTYSRIGIVHYQRNDFNHAIETLGKGLVMAQQVMNQTSMICSLTWLMWVKIRQGDMESAFEDWLTIKQAYIEQPVLYSDLELDYHQVKLWLLQDNLDEAVDWAFHYSQQEAERNNWHIRLDMVLARVRLTEKKLNDALDILEVALASAKEQGLMSWYLEGLILQAMAYSRKRKKDDALLSLAEALSLAEPEGYVRIVVDEGDALVDLLSDLIAKYREYSEQFSFSVKYVSNLLAIIKEENQVHSPLAEPLTEREFDVLRLLAAGLSNQEVADELFITLGTVKQYNHIIYRKLDVRTRNQAVQWAKDLNLL